MKAMNLAELNAGLHQVSVDFNKDTGALFVTWLPHPRPSFNMPLLRELRTAQAMLRRAQGRVVMDGDVHEVKFLVSRSGVEGRYNLGGDLELFSDCILTQNRKRLLEYAELCVDILYEYTRVCGLDGMSVALVQGDALGGGMEAAVSANILVAERSAKMGLPEILFNLFPGMGSYTYLTRKIGRKPATELILSGNTFTAEELHDMGVVDVLAEDGQGEQALNDYLRRVGRAYNGTSGLYRAVRESDPVTREELLSFTHVWVDAALKLTPRDLKLMGRLVKAQDRVAQAA